MILTDYQKQKINNILQDNINIITQQAKHFSSLNHNMIIDFYDCYQEACLATIDAVLSYKDQEVPWESYLKKTIRNHLIKFVNKNNSILNITKEVSSLCTKIFSLEREGKNLQEILSILNISINKYYDVKHILTREKFKDMITPHNEAILIINEIKESLDETELILFNLFQANYSITEIAKRLDQSYEWTRIQLNRVLKKINDIYAE